MISIFYKMAENIVVILRIYGARTIFLLFCDDKDTEYEQQEIEMNTSQLIFTHKNISRALGDNDIHNLQKGRKNCCNYSYLWS